MRPRLDIARIAALAGLFAALALPASALAEYYVPPGNSAATQYTESLPSAGGESTGKGGHGGGTASPEESLGSRNAQRLEAQGPAGEATAALAAETAPPASLVQADSGSSGGTGHDKGQGQGKQEGAQKQSGSRGEPKENFHVNQPSGSSGIGEVVAQATGSDSGNLGLWLPIVIVLTVVGSIVYRLRPHHGPTA